MPNNSANSVSNISERSMQQLARFAAIPDFSMGLTKKQIKRYSVSFKLEIPASNQLNNVENKSNDATTCSICLEHFSVNASVRRLGCMHLFHIKCIDEWLQRKHQCPFCRTPVVINYEILFQYLQSGQIIEQFWNTYFDGTFTIDDSSEASDMSDASDDPYDDLEF